ncbi:MAG: hypothetical protein IJ738_01325 [Alphaproteobacteria bacterium]|nr:hypothetical protein [Alphaproteobacteria bacterium]
MKKLIILCIVMLGIAPLPALAAQTANAASSLTLTALWLTAFLTAVIHTITGPDHYLPFIAIAKSRDFSLKKTLLWTFLCGLGHIGSALLIALVFVYFSHWLTDSQFTWIEDNRGDLAAYALIGLGGAYLLWALRHRYLHKHGKAHHHGHLMHGGTKAESKNITVWVLFIIFVLGPCEALLPILTASSVMGIPAVISSTVIFSVATIATMMVAVTCGYLGLSALRFKKMENYAHELAGATIMVCGIAILCGL